MPAWDCTFKTQRRAPHQCCCSRAPCAASPAALVYRGTKDLVPLLREYTYGLPNTVYGVPVRRSALELSQEPPEPLTAAMPAGVGLHAVPGSSAWQQPAGGLAAARHEGAAAGVSTASAAWGVSTDEGELQLLRATAEAEAVIAGQARAGGMLSTVAGTWEGQRLLACSGLLLWLGLHACAPHDAESKYTPQPCLPDSSDAGAVAACACVAVLVAGAAWLAQRHRRSARTGLLAGTMQAVHPHSGGSGAGCDVSAGTAAWGLRALSGSCIRAAVQTTPRRPRCHRRRRHRLPPALHHPRRQGAL